MTSHFKSDEKELDRLLALIGEHVDLEHCQQVRQRYAATLTYEQVDRPPLVVCAAYPYTDPIKLPEPWDGFMHYPHRQAYADPIAMMQNQLLDCVVPGLLLKDDSPLAIRNDHGTIQIASLLGGKWSMPSNDPPWLEPLSGLDAIKEVACSDQEVDIGGGVLPQSFQTLDFYREKLGQYPICQQAIAISMPDLQGPMDVAEHLWGSDIFCSFFDDAELVHRLMSRIVDVTLSVEPMFRKYAAGQSDPVANTQHAYMIPGRLLIRDDTSILLSPKQFAEFVRPHNQRLLQGVGTGSIHFCGNGQHLIEPMLQIPQLRGLDFGQAAMMDMQWAYPQARDRQVAITNIMPTRDLLINRQAHKQYPTGVTFTYRTTCYQDARAVVDAYCN